ncbi:hypothetical protein Bca4012_085424 [Brassica carinata]
MKSAWKLPARASALIPPPVTTGDGHPPPPTPPDPPDPLSSFPMNHFPPLSSPPLKNPIQTVSGNSSRSPSLLAKGSLSDDVTMAELPTTIEENPSSVSNSLKVDRSTASTRMLPCTHATPEEEDRYEWRIGNNSWITIVAIKSIGS